MRLYVMRHGPAEDRSEAVSEFDRQLTAKGREQTGAAARGLAKFRVQLGAIVTSPLVRCMQTAELVAAELTAGREPEAVDALAAGASPGEMLKVIRAHAEADLMVVGHDPDVSRLVSCLLGGVSQPFVSFSKGGVAALEARGAPEPGACRLLWYLRRKQLALLGDAA